MKNIPTLIYTHKSLCFHPVDKKSRQRSQPLTFCMLRNFACIFVNDFFLNWLFQKIFQETHQSDKKIGSRSDATYCLAWSGSKLFIKKILT